MTLQLQTKATVRGYGSVEIWEIIHDARNSEFEIAGNISKNLSWFADCREFETGVIVTSWEEALEKMNEKITVLRGLRKMMESFK